MIDLISMIVIDRKRKVRRDFVKCQQHPILKVLSDHEEATKCENYKLLFRIF